MARFKKDYRGIPLKEGDLVLLSCIIRHTNKNGLTYGIIINDKLYYPYYNSKEDFYEDELSMSTSLKLTGDQVIKIEQCNQRESDIKKMLLDSLANDKRGYYQFNPDFKEDKVIAKKILENLK